MSRGERLFGPKRNTRRNKREYRRKKGTKRYLDNKNVAISDLMGVILGLGLGLGSF